MGITMSEEELNKETAKTADEGNLAEIGWLGFKTMQDPKGEWTEEQIKAMRWAYWTGARCVYDVIFRLVLSKDEPELKSERLNKLGFELGTSSFLSSFSSHLFLSSLLFASHLFSSPLFFSSFLLSSPLLFSSFLFSSPLLFSSALSLPI